MITAHDRDILKRLPEWNPTGDITAQRRAWEELATIYNQDLPAIGGFEKRVDLRAGLTADVAVPKGAGPHPVMVYLHGGGWAFGSPTSFRKLGMQFAEAGYLTIVLDYRLAPEHPFPAAFEDTMFAVQWARDNARRWNGDGTRIAIGGDSAGGNLSLSALAASAPELRAILRAAVLFYGRLRSGGDRRAQPCACRAANAIEHIRRGQHEALRRSARQPAQGGGTGTGAVLHPRRRRGHLVPRRFAYARPSALGGREPLRTARDGRHAARLHADERARGLPRGAAIGGGFFGAQRLIKRRLPRARAHSI